jgi:alkylation response protein AidB-like acyl-CoA dehydrogenase
MINLLYSDVEEDLRATLRSLLSSRSPWSDVLARTETAKTYDLELWRSLAVDLGLAGLIVPESLGGAGASYREAAVVCEELGRAVAPVPFLGSAVVATTALLACGEETLVRAVATGERTAALAVPFSAHAAAPRMRFRPICCSFRPMPGSSRSMRAPPP